MSDLPKTSARGNAMSTSVAQQAYQCDQCGNPDIVAVPLLYQQGTRTFSGILNRGMSQSVAAQSLAPPQPRGYALRLLPWIFAVILMTCTTYFELGAFLKRPKFLVSEAGVALIFVSLCSASIWGLISTLLRTLRYNREVHPKLERDWTHSFMCRRCGKLQSIN
jgi:hypothetical protein